MLARLLVVFFLVILAFSGMETTFAWWAIAQFGWGPRPIGFVFFYVGLLSALMQGVLIGPLTRRFGEERLMLGGLGAIALGLLVLPFAREVPALVVALTALALGMGAMQPSLNSLISRRAGAGEQGEVMGRRAIGRQPVAGAGADHRGIAVWRASAAAARFCGERRWSAARS